MNYSLIYSGSDLKCQTYKSKIQVYPITGPVMNFKSKIINTLYVSSFE